IVLDAVALEHGRLLKLTTDAKLGDLRLVETSQVVSAVEKSLAAVRTRLAGDDVHHGGLAGAVRTDDCAHLTGLDRKRQVIKRPESVERDGYPIEIEQGRGVRDHDAYSAGVAIRGTSPVVRPRRPCHQCLIVPTMPRGSSSVTPMNSPPSRNSQ